VRKELNGLLVVSVDHFFFFKEIRLLQKKMDVTSVGDPDPEPDLELDP
jgi:hypothetical protein